VSSEGSSAVEEVGVLGGVAVLGPEAAVDSEPDPDPALVGMTESGAGQAGAAPCAADETVAAAACARIDAG
jgi:hypothetical protein